MKAIAALALAAALSACAHRPSAQTAGIALDELLAFSDPRLCQPSEAHARMLAGMVAGNANEGFRAGRIDASKSHSAAFGKIFVRRFQHYSVVGVPLSGTLFGLPILSIEQALPEGGDPGDVTYRFQAKVESTQRALRARGFPAEAGRAVQMGPPEGYEHVIELLADPKRSDQTLLNCGSR